MAQDHGTCFSLWWGAVRFANIGRHVGVPIAAFGLGASER
jgi:hypothetical protein